MEIRESLIKLVNSVNGSWTVAASYLNMTSVNALRNRVYETKGQLLSTYDALALQELAGVTHFAEAVASASGGTFVLLPKIDTIENDSIEAKFNDVYASVGAMFTEFRDDIKNDGVIDDIEHDRLVEKAETLHRKTEELLGLIFSVCSKKPGANAVVGSVGRRHV